MNWKQLQDEQREWSMRNFGPHPAEHPMLGMIEKLGVLAHAHLKGLQGIRHTPEEILEMKKDACAEFMIVMADYFNCKNLNLAECIRHGMKLKPDLSSIMWIVALMTETRWRELVATLAAYAKEQEFDLEEETFRAWEVVKQRNWRKESDVKS